MPIDRKEFYDELAMTLKPLRRQLRALQKRATQSKKGKPPVGDAHAKSLEATRKEHRDQIKTIIDCLRRLKQEI